VSHLAIDLGATSGRAMLGTLRDGALEIREVHRFPNVPARIGNRIHWDILRLLNEIKDAIGKVSHESTDRVMTFGIDTWGLDFGLIDASDQLLSNPYHYRDMGSRSMQTELRRRIPPAELYRRTGIQSLPFNTLDQLIRLQDERPWLLESAQTLLMTPDLLRFFLTGEKQNEYTTASTSQCLSIETSDWDTALMEQVGLPGHMFAPIVPPGSPGGTLRDSIARELGVPRIAAVAIAEHDTASAMIATGGKPGEAFLSLGTWGLLGAIVNEPIVTEAAFRANVANEGGVGGTWRFLRNIMGLWLLEQCRAAWGKRGVQLDHAEMVRLTGEATPLRAFIDPDDARLIDPPDLPEAIAAQTGLDPNDTGAILRCISDSLAMKSRQVLESIETAAGLRYPGLHVLGGGSKNAALCQAMANALGRPVLAGPAEATTIGNLLMQLQVAGEIGSIEEGAALVPENRTIREFDPVDIDRWQAAYETYCEQLGLAGAA
jgi:rhamnulokinase